MADVARLSLSDLAALFLKHQSPLYTRRCSKTHSPNDRIGGAVDGSSAQLGATRKLDKHDLITETTGETIDKTSSRSFRHCHTLRHVRCTRKHTHRQVADTSLSRFHPSWWFPGGRCGFIVPGGLVIVGFGKTLPLEAPNPHHHCGTKSQRRKRHLLIYHHPPSGPHTSRFVGKLHRARSGRRARSHRKL